jgi:hypothetical protein
MAQTDLDTMQTGKRQNAAPVEASANLAGGGESINDVANKLAAANAGVLRASLINYDVALDAYAARKDIEDLAQKNARDNPADFADASFMRTVSGLNGSGSSL